MNWPQGIYLKQSPEVLGYLLLFRNKRIHFVVVCFLQLLPVKVCKLFTGVTFTYSSVVDFELCVKFVLILLNMLIEAISWLGIRS